MPGHFTVSVRKNIAPDVTSAFLTFRLAETDVTSQLRQCEHA